MRETILLCGIKDQAGRRRSRKEEAGLTVAVVALVAAVLQVVLLVIPRSLVQHHLLDHILGVR